MEITEFIKVNDTFRNGDGYTCVVEEVFGYSTDGTIALCVASVVDGSYDPPTFFTVREVGEDRLLVGERV